MKKIISLTLIFLLLVLFIQAQDILNIDIKGGKINNKIKSIKETKYRIIDTNEINLQRKVNYMSLKQYDDKGFLKNYILSSYNEEGNIDSISICNCNDKGLRIACEIRLKNNVNKLIYKYSSSDKLVEIDKLKNDILYSKL